jgi:hypothetical protein
VGVKGVDWMMVCGFKLLRIGSSGIVHGYTYTAYIRTYIRIPGYI